MNNQHKEIWETYTSSWEAKSIKEKKNILQSCLDESCVYNDPLVKTTGWDELSNYMLEFHKQVPGGYFKTKYFLSHNDQSIARWDMLNGDNIVIGEGISYGKYNNGKLVSMTGFFENA